VIELTKRALKKTGIDAAIAYTILTRVIQASSGLISIFFITRYLSAHEQGYYYTFASIIAIQIFFELGLSGILTQYTAHEFAHLNLNNNVLEGEDYYKSRLSSLLRFCIKWFGIVSIALFFVLVLLGFLFFSHYGKTATVNWQKPWVVLCLATSLNLFIDPILAFFDGLGEVKDMAKVRLIQKIANILLLFLFFGLGFKLYSSALASLIAIGFNYFQVFFSKRMGLLRTIWNVQREWRINYFEEIFPFQWRIALSWISGYFIFQLFNPVLFATDGSVVAGQMGMTLSALGGVLSVSMSWINTKVPLFSKLIAKKEYNELDTIFNKIIKQACFICAVCLILLILGVWFLEYNHYPVGKRFLPIIPLILLAIATFVNQYVFAIATYLRCHKQEPFLTLSIVMGILTALSTLILGNIFGVYGITIGYTFLIVVVSLIWAITIFNNKKLQWHQ
jgi:O-antigen/teichoic acid export membrane protein